MALVHPSMLKVAIAMAVGITFWLAGAESAQAGCGEHGYVVQRANGDLVVVTPSQPSCLPCKGKGPQCKQSEAPASPAAPGATPPPGDDAWRGEAFCGVPASCGVGILFLDLGSCISGLAGEIFHPPRI